ncbi:MAG: hypothetical protein FP825_12910 [Hyphomonas sp.]|uniref:hypothetical protein n=1 Tax=Hyphomonas sp. TaxID=87 RepID=UPI0017BC446C|nr:hypothetical protein [Hyphomonas sp.]MBA3069364.1 hypothetical protein [Hyphomonas sp.]MBU4063746.1 phospholipase [Alphaproteobacteria bacterium]MBU4164293.1 phospholipase [Alphaproteobacteria bacterium]MBU4568482.1 phospholipase [Alphaproteobacteria bacterium]
MQRSSCIALASVWLIAACASAPGIDRPVALDPAYAVRETGASKPSDRCGPEFISDHMPKSLVAFIGPALDGPFRPACERHDACYELREQTQSWCDDRMRTEMMDICAAGRSDGSATGALCRARAGLYFSMVDNTFGAHAYEGEAGGRIAALEITAAPVGELEVCVTAENHTQLLQAYVVELRTSDGQRFSREPRIKQRSVRAGQSAVMCAGSVSSTYWNLRRLKGPVQVQLLAARPETLGLAQDRVIVDQRTIALPVSGTN